MRRFAIALIAVLTGCTGGDVTGSGSPDPALPLALKSVTIEGSVWLVTGSSAALTAVAIDMSNMRVRNPSVIWTTSDPHIATVSEAGIVSGVNEGSVTITASIGDKEAKATLNVIASGITEVYWLVSVDDQPLPVKSPWGVGEWDYDSDAGTWQLTYAAVTLFSNGAFTYMTTHRAASGNTVHNSWSGRYERDSSSLQFSSDGRTWSATISGKSMTERWADGRTLAFQRSEL